jgi:hypothetical protein
MKLIIDRTQWFRGQGYMNSRLLDGDGMKCCLGFYSLAKGYSETDILRITSPAFLPDKGEKISELVEENPRKNEICQPIVNNDLCMVLMDVNDDTELTETAREKQIRANFETIGVEVEFIN